MQVGVGVAWKNRVILKDNKIYKHMQEQNFIHKEERQGTKHYHFLYILEDETNILVNSR